MKQAVSLRSKLAVLEVAKNKILNELEIASEKNSDCSQIIIRLAEVRKEIDLLKDQWRLKCANLI